MPAEFVFDEKTIADTAKTRVTDLKPGTDCIFEVQPKNGASAKILLLTQSQSRTAYRANIWGAERLLLSRAGLLPDGDVLRMQSSDTASLSVAVYPPTQGLEQTKGIGAGHADGVFEHFDTDISAKKITAQWKRIKPAALAPEVKKDKRNVAVVPDDSAFDGAEVWQITVPKSALDEAHETFLQIHYAGDIARAYIGDQLVDDDFYFGRLWEIGLRRFAPDALQKGITLKNSSTTRRHPYLYPEGSPA